MESEFRFLKTVGGITYFARVTVEVDTSADVVTVVDAIDPPASTRDGDFDRATASGWVDAALAGARTAAEHAVRAGCAPRGCAVRIRRLVGSHVDTREDVVACTAALATWRAACPDRPTPEAMFQDGVWSVSWSAS